VSGSAIQPNPGLKFVAAGILPAAAAAGARAPNTIGCTAIALTFDWQIILAEPCEPVRRIVQVTSKAEVGQPFTPSVSDASANVFFITSTTALGVNTRVTEMTFAVWEMPITA
jgi:hypothetical protein